MAEGRFLADLQRFWDAIAQGEPASPGDLDPELAATIEQWHALPDVPLPEPTYANQLRESIMHTASIPVFPPLPHPGNGRLTPHTPRVILPSLPLHTLPRRRMGQELFALLLVAALLMGAVGIILRNQQGPDQRANAPLLATPEAAPAGTDWTMYRGDPARTGFTTEPGPEGQPVVLWQYTAGGTAWRSPAVSGGVAYLQSGEGVVQALDIATGDVLWQVTLGSVSDTPAIAGDTLFVNTGLGDLIALDATNGMERWRFAQQVAAQTTPLVLDGVAYTGSDDGTVYALNANSGEVRWSATVGGAISRSISLADGILYVPTATGSMHALDANTGEALWQATGDPNGFTGTSAVANGVVYLRHSGQQFALDARTGEERWQIPDTGSPLSAGPDTLVSINDAGLVQAYAATDGAVLWTFDTGAKIQAAPLTAGDTVYVSSFNHNLYALDLATGAERWAFELDGATDFGPSLADGVFYIGTDAGTLYALGGSGTSQLTAAQQETPAAATPEAAASSIPAPAALVIPSVVTEPTLVHHWTRSRDQGDVAGMFGGIAIDPFSRIWVCNQNDGSFDIFDRDGNKLSHIAGGRGSEPGQWNWQIGTQGVGSNWLACSIAFAPDGTAYVTDGGNKRVQVLAPDGTLKTTWSTEVPSQPELQGPIWISRLSNGEFLITDWSAQDVIRRFSADGTYLEMFEPADGVVETIFDPAATLIDSDGNIWVTELAENRVIKLTPDGELLLAIGGPNPGTQPGQFSEPTNMTLDEHGNVYVADDDNSRLQVFDANGTFIAEFTGEEAGITPFGADGGGFPNVAAGGNGYLFVTDYADDDLAGDERLMKLQVLLPPDADATPTP